MINHTRPRESSKRDRADHQEDRREHVKRAKSGHDENSSSDVNKSPFKPDVFPAKPQRSSFSLQEHKRPHVSQQNHAEIARNNLITHLMQTKETLFSQIGALEQPESFTQFIVGRFLPFPGPKSSPHSVLDASSSYISCLSQSAAYSLWTNSSSKYEELRRSLRMSVEKLQKVPGQLGRIPVEPMRPASQWDSILNEAVSKSLAFSSDFSWKLSTLRNLSQKSQSTVLKSRATFLQRCKSTFEGIKHSQPISHMIKSFWRAIHSSHKSQFENTKHALIIDRPVTLKTLKKCKLPKDLFDTFASALNAQSSKPPKHIEALRKKSHLLDHQISTLSFMSHMLDINLPCIVADNPKTGKKRSVLQFFLASKAKPPFALFAPKSTLLQYEMEISRFTPSLSIWRSYHPSDQPGQLYLISVDEDLPELAVDFSVSVFDEGPPVKRYIDCGIFREGVVELAQSEAVGYVVVVLRELDCCDRRVKALSRILYGDIGVTDIQHIIVLLQTAMLQLSNDSIDEIIELVDVSLGIPDNPELRLESQVKTSPLNISADENSSMNNLDPPKNTFNALALSTASSLISSSSFQSLLKSLLKQKVVLLSSQFRLDVLDHAMTGLGIAHFYFSDLIMQQVETYDFVMKLKSSLDAFTVVLANFCVYDFFIRMFPNHVCVIVDEPSMHRHLHPMVTPEAPLPEHRIALEKEYRHFQLRDRKSLNFMQKYHMNMPTSLFQIISNLLDTRLYPHPSFFSVLVQLEISKFPQPSYISTHHLNNSIEDIIQEIEALPQPHSHSTDTIISLLPSETMNSSAPSIRDRVPSMQHITLPSIGSFTLQPGIRGTSAPIQPFLQQFSVHSSLNSPIGLGPMLLPCVSLTIDTELKPLSLQRERLRAPWALVSEQKQRHRPLETSRQIQSIVLHSEHSRHGSIFVRIPWSLLPDNMRSSLSIRHSSKTKMRSLNLLHFSSGFVPLITSHIDSKPIAWDQAVSFWRESDTLLIEIVAKFGPNWKFARHCLISTPSTQGRIHTADELKQRHAMLVESSDSISQESKQQNTLQTIQRLTSLVNTHRQSSKNGLKSQSEFATQRITMVHPSHIRALENGHRRLEVPLSSIGRALNPRQIIELRYIREKDKKALPLSGPLTPKLSALARKVPPPYENLAQRELMARLMGEDDVLKGKVMAVYEGEGSIEEKRERVRALIEEKADEMEVDKV